MRTLQLDFIARPPPLYRAGLWLLPVLVLFAAYLVGAYWKNRQELDGKQAKVQQMQADRTRQQAMQQAASEAALPPAAREQLRLEIMRANELIMRLATPWDNLFDAIDSVVDEQTALLSIAPNSEKKSVRIIGQAKDLSAMLAFQKRLNSLALLKSAHLVSHQIQVQDPARAVDFEIDAKWPGALAKGER